MKGNINEMKTPYALYVGGAVTRANAKLAAGVVEWAPELVACTVGDSENLFNQIDVHEQQLHMAKERGAKTFVIGYLPIGARLDGQSITAMTEAMKNGMDVAAALHDKINECPALVQVAEKYGRTMYDFRHHSVDYPLGNGLPREGYRVLTVGTDCNCGKKYTALALHRILRENNNAKFCATGQTGFLISGNGINNDTVVADFLAGAAEYLSPSDESAIYLIEGQGAIRHPAYCGGSMSLIAGSQPDGFILCHAVGRNLMRKTDRRVSLSLELTSNMQAAVMHGRYPDLLAISVNFMEASYMSEMQKKNYIAELTKRFNVPVFDPSSDLSVMQEVAKTIEKNAETKRG